jgi:hypothetical protein
MCLLLYMLTLWSNVYFYVWPSIQSLQYIYIECRFFNVVLGYINGTKQLVLFN